MLTASTAERITENCNRSSVSIKKKKNKALEALVFTKDMGLMSPKLVIANTLCLYGKAAENISSVAVQK